MNRALAFGVGAAWVLALMACEPQGYVSNRRLNSAEQGPQHCAARCEELGMAMGAMVLVGTTLPACVCVPRPGGAPAPGATTGASGAVGGHVVIAAAAEAAHRQQQSASTTSSPATTTTPQPSYRR